MKMELNHVFFWLLVACAHVCSGNESYRQFRRSKASAPHDKWEYKDNGSKTLKRSAHIAWDYGTNGPTTWDGECKGTHQSPINIVTCETSNSTVNNRARHNYGKKASGEYTIKNNGHALQIDLPTDTEYKLKKEDKTYTPLQIHIHFDPLTGKGSEHTLNSHKYFAEIHIVHKDTESNGLLVIGMFVQLVKGSDVKPSFAMRVFGNAARKLKKPGRNMTRDAFPLKWLLPKVERKNSNLDYVNYKGSLTTPPCSEIVDWIVITGKVLHVDQETADNFKSVMNSAGTAMGGNNRPIQDVNGRDVYGVKEYYEKL